MLGRQGPVPGPPDSRVEEGVLEVVKVASCKRQQGLACQVASDHERARFYRLDLHPRLGDVPEHISR
jgi:hypothetical protein